MWDILVHLFSIVILPLAFAVGLLRARQTQWEWWSTCSLALAVTGWAVVVGRWDLAGYVFRFVLPIGVVAVAYVGWRRMRAAGGRSNRGRVWNFSVLLNLVLALIFLAQAGIGIAGFFSATPGIELAFPLRDGAYYVLQGGRTVLINYHAAYTSQQYALDITRLNSLSFRAAGVYPSELDKYAIFGEPVYSPCTGEVIAARAGLPDHRPPSSDPGRPEGNFVVIRCDGVDVFLAHFQENTLSVHEGDLVTVGQSLGRVGNSGSTTEPHLHIHAERRAEVADGATERVGVPIRFNGRFLARNSVVAVE